MLAVRIGINSVLARLFILISKRSVKAILFTAWSSCQAVKGFYTILRSYSIIPRQIAPLTDIHAALRKRCQTSVFRAAVGYGQILIDFSYAVVNEIGSHVCFLANLIIAIGVQIVTISPLEPGFVAPGVSVLVPGLSISCPRWTQHYLH
jgi:hypothetical protein